MFGMFAFIQSVRSNLQTLHLWLPLALPAHGFVRSKVLWRSVVADQHCSTSTRQHSSFNLASCNNQLTPLHLRLRLRQIKSLPNRQAYASRRQETTMTPSYSMASLSPRSSSVDSIDVAAEVTLGPGHSKQQGPGTAAVLNRLSYPSTSDVSTRAAYSIKSLGVWLACSVVTLYDMLMRLVMVSYYIIDLELFDNAQHYLRARATKQTRRYLEQNSSKFHAAVRSGAVIVQQKPAFDARDYSFACEIFKRKHGKPWLLFWAWRMMMELLRFAPEHTTFTTISDPLTGATIALFVEFRQRNFHHFITALVDHAASKSYGIYVAKYVMMLDQASLDGVRIMRLGPTTDDLKAGMGAVKLPLFVVGSPVWARLEGRCSVVCFGIFTSLALFAYIWLTQWHMDASGLGALSLQEFMLLYLCCITCVKCLPFYSIGIVKVLMHPKKYLLQTSFYAQGVLFGALAFIAVMSFWRKVHPLVLIDALCLFLMVGDIIGRLGCHFYGCCFGKPCKDFHPLSVVYLDRQSSVSRLRPEYRLLPLLPTQLCQSLFALIVQASLLLYVAHLAALSTAVKEGTIGVVVLGAYSIGRILFFAVRDDEKFKSNRSYTTAYVALATLGLCAAASAYIYLYSPASTIVLFQQPSARDAWKYTLVASATAFVNFIVQSLHHHEKVGQFPDVSLLLANRKPQLLSSWDSASRTHRL